MDEYPQLYCQYRSGVKDILLRKQQKEAKPVPKVIWIWGATGTGKTRYATE